MIAKRFFFVCAGLLCLAAAYHLGARSATAQGDVTVSAVDQDNGIVPDLVATSNGDVYHGHHGFQGEDPVWTLVGHIPAFGPVESISNLGTDSGVWAYDAAGNYYHSSDHGVSWVRRGNVFGGGPTSATRKTWGCVKSRYR